MAAAKCRSVPARGDDDDPRIVGGHRRHGKRDMRKTSCGLLINCRDGGRRGARQIGLTNNPTVSTAPMQTIPDPQHAFVHAMQRPGAEQPADDRAAAERERLAPVQVWRRQNSTTADAFITPASAFFRRHRVARRQAGHRQHGHHQAGFAAEVAAVDRDHELRERSGDGAEVVAFALRKSCPHREHDRREQHEPRHEAREDRRRVFSNSSPPSAPPTTLMTNIARNDSAPRAHHLAARPAGRDLRETARPSTWMFAASGDMPDTISAGSVTNEPPPARVAQFAHRPARMTRASIGAGAEGGGAHLPEAGRRSERTMVMQDRGRRERVRAVSSRAFPAGAATMPHRPRPRSRMARAGGRVVLRRRAANVGLSNGAREIDWLMSGGKEPAGLGSAGVRCARERSSC